MMMDNRVRQTVLPQRIVAVFGNVRNAECLLKEKPLQITIAERDCATLRNGDGEEAAILLDFGREMHGALRLLTFKVEGCRYANVQITLGNRRRRRSAPLGGKMPPMITPSGISPGRCRLTAT